MIITDRTDYKRLRRLGLSHEAAKRNAARRHVDISGDNIAGGVSILFVAILSFHSVISGGVL